TQNSNGDAATAVSTTIKYLTSNPKPDFTWAGNEGNQIAAMIPVMKQRGLLAGAVNDGNTQCQTKAAADCPTFFSLGASPATAAEAYANWAKTNGYKNVGILEEGIAFTQSETPAVSAALDKLGIKHEKVSFPGTAINVTSQVSQLKGKGVDAVFAEALGPAAGYTLAARTKLGWKVPLLFDVAGSSLDLTKLSKPGDLDGVQVTLGTPTDGAIDSPGVTAMVENAKTYGGLGGQPLYIAAFGWDAMVTLHNAIAQAKSTDPKAVAAAMESLSPAAQSDPMLTLSKKISYSADNHENNSYAPSDYKIVDAGPLKGGQIG
ncbi:MAG TPA: ABC transporter substrate-binding protein, partial [Baekduia sp.]